MCKDDDIHKTGNTPEYDRATVIGNTHKNLAKIRAVLEIFPQTDKHIARQTDTGIKVGRH